MQLARAAEGLRVFWLMARPTHQLLILLVYSVGAAMALALGARLDLDRLLFGLLPLLLVSLSIHYVNEFVDVETDSVTSRTPFSGGSGALPGSPLSTRVAIMAATISLAVGLLAALWGMLGDRLHPSALAVLGVGAALGWMYSIPPISLAWRGWGELANSIAGGMALPLFGYTVLSPRLELSVVAACLPFVALVFLNMLATTWPDRKADALVGKCTLAVRWRPAQLRRLYWTLAGGFAVVIPLLVGWSLPTLVGWTSYLMIPLVLLGGLGYTRRESPLAAVAAMVTLAFVQLAAWLALIG